jgi:hypothetical protein
VGTVVAVSETYGRVTVLWNESQRKTNVSFNRLNKYQVKGR